MAILDGLKEGLYKKKIRECTAKNKKRKAINFDMARNVGILFNASNDADVKVVLNYSKDLKHSGKKVSLMAFKGVKALNGKEEFPCICNKDLRINMTPKKGEVLEFINQKFDLLISLHTQECLPLEYISTASSALFRIGYYQENKTDAYDFMVYGKSKSLRVFILQMETYMKKIN
jgi:hypothetical protein